MSHADDVAAIAETVLGTVTVLAVNRLESRTRVPATCISRSTTDTGSAHGGRRRAKRHITSARAYDLSLRKKRRTSEPHGSRALNARGELRKAS